MDYDGSRSPPPGVSVREREAPHRTRGAPAGPPEYTVSQLAAALQRTVESRFGRIRLRGEISGCKQAGSGHLYFDLKDAGAVLAAVCWRSTVPHLRTIPEDGLEVVVNGRLTTYPARSQVQVVVDSVEIAGQGALLQVLEARRRKLAAEGLFDSSRKQPLPHLPEVIGLVTSPAGAALRDILHRLRDRFPRRVLLWPVPVQGDAAAETVARAIRGFQRLPPTGGPVPRPDLLIVARGGGSIEDLWAFNEEVVVRAAAASAIPLISAVGHETDTTLLDHAADVRAPTPTAAAEMAVPVRADLRAEVRSLDARLGRAAARALSHRRERLAGLARGLRGPRDLLERGVQRLDHCAERLGRGLTVALDAWTQRLSSACGRLGPALLRRLAEDGARRSGDAGARLSREAVRGLARRGDTVRHLSDLLESVSHRRVLSRGYALLRGSRAQPLMSAHEVRPGMALDIELRDGHVPATAGAGTAPRRAARHHPAAPRGARQESLW